MTNIELQQAHANIRMANAITSHIDNNDCWEARRFELIKAAITGAATNNLVKNDYVVRKAIRIADEIINELKNENRD